MIHTQEADLQNLDSGTHHEVEGTCRVHESMKTRRQELLPGLEALQGDSCCLQPTPGAWASEKEALVLPVLMEGTEELHASWRPDAAGLSPKLQPDF